jgi:hypothetical protein
MRRLRLSQAQAAFENEKAPPPPPQRNQYCLDCEAGIEVEDSCFLCAAFEEEQGP